LKGLLLNIAERLKDAKVPSESELKDIGDVGRYYSSDEY
jgi:hypothetical protein